MSLRADALSATQQHDIADPSDAGAARLLDAFDASILEGVWSGDAAETGHAEAATIALRDAIRGYAGVMKARGVPPERMLVGVKALVRRRMPTLLPHEATTASESVVRWCVAAYYEGVSTPARPSRRQSPASSPAAPTDTAR